MKPVTADKFVEELKKKRSVQCFRHTGKQHGIKLLNILEKHAPVMPRIALNIAIEKMDSDQKTYFHRLNT